MRSPALLAAATVIVGGCAPSAPPLQDHAGYVGTYSTSQPVNIVVERIVSMARTCWADTNQSDEVIDVAEGHGVITLIHRARDRSTRHANRRLEIRERGDEVEIRTYMRQASMDSQADLVAEWAEGRERCARSTDT
ncbi:MAG: hypothetical protein WD382_01425 [Halofilum sp. (in: g-proteobacteria)]